MNVLFQVVTDDLGVIKKVKVAITWFCMKYTLMLYILIWSLIRPNGKLLCHILKKIGRKFDIDNELSISLILFPFPLLIFCFLAWLIMNSGRIYWQNNERRMFLTIYVLYKGIYVCYEWYNVQSWLTWIVSNIDSWFLTTELHWALPFDPFIW